MDYECSNIGTGGPHVGFEHSLVLELASTWGSVKVSKDKIRFAITTDAYVVWWGRISKHRGSRRLALAPELGPLFRCVRL
jgi:hypothetical protein